MSNPFVMSFFLTSTLFIRMANSLPPQYNGVASDTSISKKTFKIPEVIITKKTPQSYLNQVSKNLYRNYYIRPYSANFHYQKYVFNPDSLFVFSDIKGSFMSSNLTTSLMGDKFFVDKNRYESKYRLNYSINPSVPKNELYEPLFADMVRNSVGRLNFDYPILKFTDAVFPYPFPVHNHYSYSILRQYEISKTKYLVISISDWEKKNETINLEDKPLALKYRSEYEYFKNIGNDSKIFPEEILENESTFIKYKKEQIEKMTCTFEVHINLSDYSVFKIIGKCVKFLDRKSVV